MPGIENDKTGNVAAAVFETPYTLISLTIHTKGLNIRRIKSEKEDMYGEEKSGRKNESGQYPIQVS